MAAHALSLPPSRPGGSRGAVAALIGVCFVGLALRLWLGWWMGHLGDIECWQLWGLDPGEYVSRPEYPPRIANNYPPMYPSILRIMRWAHRGLGLPGDYTRPLQIYFHPNPNEWRPLILYLKIPPIFADMVTACLLFLIGRHFGQLWLGVGLAAFHCLSPGILYDGAYYGQTDTILVMFLVAAVWAWIRQRPVWLGAMLVAAPLMKAQAVFALPVLGMAILGQWKVWRPYLARIMLGGLVTLAIVAGLAWWTGQLRQFYHGYAHLASYYPLVTVRAYNFWWLLTRPWDKPPQHYDFPRDDTLLLGLISYRMIGVTLFFAVLGLILWRLHRARYTPYALALALVAAGWAFFNLPTQMHERYSIPAVGLMALLPLWDRRWWWSAGLVSITSMLNIAHVCYFLFPPSKWLTALVNKFIFGEMQASWVVFAVIHILMLPLTLEALWRQGTRRGSEQPSDTDSAASLGRFQPGC